MKCPNKNAPEWKSLNNAVGETMAFVLFTKNDSIPDYTAHPAYKSITNQYSEADAIRTLAMADYRDVEVTPENFEDKMYFTEGTFNTNKIDLQGFEFTEAERTVNFLESFDSTQQKELLSSIYTVFAQQPGDTAAEKMQNTKDWFALNSYSFVVDGNRVPLTDITLADALIKKEAQYITAVKNNDENARDIGIEYAKLLTKSLVFYGKPVKIERVPPDYINDVDGFSRDELRIIYTKLYKNWDTQPSNPDVFEGKTVEEFFKNGVMRYYNMRFPKNMDAPIAEEASFVFEGENAMDVADALEVGSNEITEKIHDKSFLEENPMNKLSGEVKTFLSTLESDSVGILGINNMIPFETVYGDVASIMITSETLSEFLTTLKQEAEFKPYLNQLYNQFNAKSSKFKSLFFRNMALNLNELFLIRVSNKVKTIAGQREYYRQINFINSNQYTKKQHLISQWRDASIKQQGETRNTLFTKIVEDGNVSYKINEAKAVEIYNKYKSLSSELSQKETALQDRHIQEFISLLGEFGLFNTPKDIFNAVKTYINSGIYDRGILKKGKPALNLLLGKNGISPLIDSAGGLINSGKPNESIADPFSSFNKFFTRMAEIQAKVEPELIGSFTNIENKSIFPINMRTSLSDAILKIKKRQYFNENHLRDVYFNPETGNKNKLRSLYLEYFHEDGDLSTSSIGGLEVKTFDGSKVDSSDPKAYRDLSEKSSLELRLQSFLFGNNPDFVWVALPNQSDRNRMDFIRVPKYNKRHDLKTIVRANLFQELSKVARNRQQYAEADGINNLYENYHYKLKDGKKVPGNGLQIGGIFANIPEVNALFKNITPSQVQEMINRINSPEVSEIVNNVYNLFEQFVDNQVNNLTDRMLDLQVFSNIKVDNKIYFQASKKGKNTKVSVPFESAYSLIPSQELRKRNYGTIEAFARDYYLNDLIHKHELIKMLRVDDAFAKNYEDFSKRFGTVNTPGYKLLLQGDIKNEPDYGFFKELSESTINDDFVRDSNFYNTLLSNESTKEFAEAYNPKGVNKTDAQGFMSVETYRAYMQGMGDWTPNDEAAYINYNDSSKTNPLAGKLQVKLSNGKIHSVKIKPIKPYQEQIKFENGMLVMHSIKNSYMVLTKEMTKGSPTLDDLRQRMDAEGQYEGQNKINLVNTVSTRKLAKTNVYNIQHKLGEFGALRTTTLSGESFRVPQIKPDSENSRDTLFGSQFMRLVLPSINDIKNKVEYLVNGKKVKAIDLVDKYHSIVNKRLELATNKLVQELDMPTKDTFTEEQHKTFLRNLKNKIIEGAESSNRNLTNNQMKALDLIDTEMGPDFKIPASFPAYAKQYEQLIFSLFRNEVIKLPINGKQVVQAAELGNWFTDSRLQMMRPSDGDVLKAQIVVSPDVAKKMGYKKGMKLEDFPAEAIGYRIPTQGKNSMISFEIVDILPDNYESTVIVPGEITVQMGSDFDIDSIFMIMPNTTYDKRHNKSSKIGFDIESDINSINNDLVLQNALYEISNSIITNPQHIGEVLRPLDGDLLTNLIKKYPIEDSNVNRNDWNAEIELQLRNRDGASGIGIYANSLMGHVTGQFIDISSEADVSIDGNSSFRLNEINDFSGRPVIDNIKEHMNAALDNAKTPKMKALNDNPMTSNVTIAMLQSGFSVEQAFLLRRHPAIVELSRVYENNEFNPYQILEAIKITYGNITGEEFNTGNIRNASIELFSERLSEAIETNNPLKDIEDVLIAFYKFHQNGSDIIKLNKVITPNRIKDMSSMSAIDEYLDLAQEIELKYNMSVIDQYPLNKGYYAAIRDSYNVVSQFIPYNSSFILSLKDTLKDVTGIKGTKKNVHEAVNSAVLHYLFTLEGSPFYNIFTESKIRELLIDSGNIVDQFRDLKEKYSDVFDSNGLLTYMTPDFNSQTEIIKKLRFVNAYGNTADTIDLQSEGFNQLLNHPEQELRNFAKNLIDYTLLTTGFQNSATSLIKAIPTEFWVESGAADYMRDVLDRISSEIESLEFNGLLDSIIRHNIDTIGILKGVPMPQGTPTTKSFSSNEASSLGILNNNDIPVVYFKGTNKGESVLYKLSKSYPDKFVYTKVDSKGQAYSLIEHNIRNDKGEILTNSVLSTESSTIPSTQILEGVSMEIGYNKSLGKETIEISKTIKTKDALTKFVKGKYKDLPYSISRENVFKTLDSDTVSQLLELNPQIVVMEYFNLIQHLKTNKFEIKESTHRNIFETIVNRNAPARQLKKVGEVSGSPTATHLIKTFEALGIDVEVIIDNNIEGYGEVNITDGKAVIKLQERRGIDTEYHEFAHIYIELIDQFDKKLIEDGYNQLRGTEIDTEIRSLYRGLTEEKLKHEVLVTAIGQQAAELSNKPAWKIWLNRLWYATRKLFGLKDNNVARSLALDLVRGKLRSNNPSINRISLTAKQLKNEARTKNIINKMITSLENQERTLRMQMKDETLATRKKYVAKKLDQLLEQKGEIINEIQPLISFIDDAYDEAVEVTKLIDDIENTDNRDRYKHLKKIGYISQFIDRSELIEDLQDLTKEMSLFGENAGVYKDKLYKTLEAQAEAKRAFKRFAAPAMASALMPHVNKEVLDSLNKTIEDVQEGKTEVPLKIKEKVRVSPAYKQLLEEKNYKLANVSSAAEKTDIENQFKNRLNTLYINALKNLLPTHSNIENILLQGTAAYYGFSSYLDPTVWSHDQSIQLFTLLVKEKLEDARKETLDVDREQLIDIIEDYKKKTGKSEFNAEEFYSAITEVVEVQDYKDGKLVPKNVLSLIQEYDISKFSSLQREFYKKLEEKYGVPNKFEYPDLWADFKETNPEKYSEYRKELSEFFRQNTVPKEGWRQEYDALKAELSHWEMLSKQKSPDPTFLAQLSEADAAALLREVDNIDNNIRRLQDEIAENIIEFKGEKIPIRNWSQPSERFKNERYKKLQENKVDFEFYTKMKNFYFRKQDEVGTAFYKRRNKWDTHSYILPSIRKNTGDALIEQGVFESLKEKVIDSTQIVETGSESIEYSTVKPEFKTIPVYYTELVDHKEVTNNLGMSLLQMAKKANEFKAKSSIEGHLNTMNFLLKERKMTALDYRNNPVLENARRGNVSTIKGVDSKEYQHFENFIDHIFYGQSSEKAEFSLFGKTFEANKVVSTINSMAAYNVFPLNFLQGTANVLHGNILLAEEAASGTFFGWSEYRKALQTYGKYSAGIIHDLGKNKPVSFLGQLIEYFDAQEGQSMQNLTNNVFGGTLKNMSSTEQLMFIQRSGELQMAATPLLALLHKESAKDASGNVIMRNGKELKLIDAFSVKDGKLVLDSEVSFDKKERMRVMNKIHGINRSLQGIYDTFNRSALSKYWYGKALLLFRSWMMSGLRRNWGYAGGGLRIDHETGVITDGIIRTLLGYLGNMRVEKSINFYSQYKKLNAFEKQNINKAIVRAVATVGSIALAFGLQDDEEDPNNWLENFAMYQSKRLRSELQFWYNPLETYKLIRSPMAGQLIIEKSLRFAFQLFNPFEEYQRSVGPKEKGDNKLYWRLKELLPVLHNIDKSQFPEEAAKFFDISVL